MQLPRVRFRIGLRGLMVLVLIIGGVLGWKARRARLQRHAVAEVQRLGGYEREFRQSVELDQLACLDGIEHVESLTLVIKRLDPAGLARLVKLNRLKSLTLYCDQLDPKRTGQLGRLTELEYLRTDVPSDNDNLAFLARLPKLRHFVSYQKKIDDSGLAWIARCERLEEVEIIAPRITDAGLKHLANMKLLKGLQVLAASQITDVGLAYLGSLTNLTRIDIRGMPVTDAGLAHLSKLPHLKYLSVSPGTLDEDAIEKYFEKSNPELLLQVVTWSTK
jgi:hypothetical protein